MSVPGFIIAGTHSGVGKTTVSLGLMAALTQRGFKVQPFKIGPDYIDVGLHQAAAGRVSHNLDTWLCHSSQVQEIFRRYSYNAGAVVVEGVMGLYDGMRNGGEAASTAQISKFIGLPVVLVVSAKGMGRSIGAVVQGYCNFDSRVNIVGVIINHVGSATHEMMLRQVLENDLGIPVFGALSRDSTAEIPSRHLGLLPATEFSDLPKTLSVLANKIEQQVDIDQLLTVVSNGLPTGISLLKSPNSFDIGGFNITLAVALDEAFNFYYQDSLHYLQQLGAKLIFFSPLHDQQIPSSANGLLLGGGFPEIFLPLLADNKAMLNSIKKHYQHGLPIYAECGGFMYLCKNIVGSNGVTYSGVGLVPGEARIKNRLSALGYVEATLQQDCLLGQRGQTMHGHEFHWSEITGLSTRECAYRLQGGRGRDNRMDGYIKNNLFASFVHIHFRGSSRAAQNLLAACDLYRPKKGDDT